MWFLFEIAQILRKRRFFYQKGRRSIANESDLRMYDPTEVTRKWSEKWKSESEMT